MVWLDLGQGIQTVGWGGLDARDLRELVWCGFIWAGFQTIPWFRPCHIGRVCFPRVAHVAGQRPAGLGHAHRVKLLMFVSVYEASQTEDRTFVW